MRALTLGFIILGLLSYTPMTGYDLKAFFDRSINFFWSAELSQIYRELSRLEKQGYISFKTEHQEGRPDKKIYSITQEGEGAFMEWLRDFPDTLSTPSRNEFLVRIFFSSKLQRGELTAQLEDYIDEQERELKIYEQIEKKLSERLKEKGYEGDTFCQRMTVKRGISFARSEISWAKECIEELKVVQN